MPVPGWRRTGIPDAGEYPLVGVVEIPGRKIVRIYQRLRRHLNVHGPLSIPKGDGMSYSLEQAIADSGIPREEIDEAKKRMLEEMRAYELKEARKTRKQRRGSHYLRK